MLIINFRPDEIVGHFSTCSCFADLIGTPKRATPFQNVPFQDLWSSLEGSHPRVLGLATPKTTGDTFEPELDKGVPRS